MIYYEFKPIKAIYAIRGQYGGLQPINAIYYGSRKIWSPDQIPLDKVIINISSYGLGDGTTDIDVGYYEYEFDPAARQPILTSGSITLQTDIGTYFAIDALPFNYPSTPPQVNIYVEKEGESGVLYENTNFIELDTSAPAIYNIVV